MHLDELDDLVCRGAAAIAIVCAAVLGLNAQAQSGSVGRGTRLDIPFGDLCESAPYEAVPVAIVGPHLLWTRGLPRGKTPGDIVRAMSDSPRTWIAASPRWLVVHDASTGKTTRADCETRDVVAFEQREPITTLAVSSFGDIAEQLQDGRTIVRARELSKGPGRDVGPRPVDIRSEGPRLLAWAGRRLVVVTRTTAAIEDAETPEYSSRPAFVPLGLAADPSAAFVYNGLTYVSSGGCIDVLVGVSLTPRLRRAACLPANAPQDAVLAVTRDSVSVLASRGDLLDDIPRPTVVDAKLSGTTFEMTSNLLQLIESPAIDRVPLSNGRDPRRGGQDSPGDWATLVPEKLWNIKGGQERMLRDVMAKGWTDLRQEQTWHSGNGIAVAWRSGSSFIAPQGRGVDELARLTTDQPEFTKAQIAGIIGGNSQLAETLEGVLIEGGWVPIGAFFDTESAGPTALLSPNSQAKYRGGVSAAADADMRTRLTPDGQCRAEQGTRTDAALSAQLRRGIPIAGALDGRSFDRMLRSDEVVVHICGGGPAPLQVAELKSSYTGSPMAQQGPSRPEPASVVAVRGFSPDVSDALVRSWLDRFLRARPNLRPLLIPTTSLEMMFVLSARGSLDSLRVQGLRGVQLTSTEAVPASARAQDDDPCKVVAKALSKRALDEQMISLQGVQFANRALIPPLKIAVAENAVPLLSPLFSRDNKSIWVEPKELGGFDSVQAPLVVDPTARQARFLKHGTQVAGILFTSGTPIPGVLADVPLVWIDTVSSPANSVPTLDQLASRKAIVNVSARLDSTWQSLSDANTHWTSGLLFVAAARDVNETLDGPPLTWTTRGNVIGVGVVNAAGSLPNGSNYDRDVVDILAPGEAVPTVEDDTNVGCADGTSYAAAYVSAVAAILANSAPGGWTVSQIKARLLATADWKPAYSGKVKGGVLNATRALENLDKNVLVIKRGTNAPLQMNVIWKDGNEFRIFGVERPNSPPAEFRIQWSDVLRWDAVKEDDGTESTRVTFLKSERFVVLEKVSVQANLTLPLDRCTNHDDGQPIQCSGTRVELIKGYTAALPRPPTIEFK